MLRNLHLSLTVQFAFAMIGCSPATQTDYRHSNMDDSKLRAEVERIFGFSLPEGALVIEALTNGGRDADFWCLLSCDSATSDGIEAAIKKELGPRASWSSTESWNKRFIEDHQIPRQLQRHFAIAKPLATKTFLYSFSDSRQRFEDGVLILFVPDRAWVILYYRRT